MTNKLGVDATSQGRQPATSSGAPEDASVSPTLFPRILAFVDRVSGGRADWVVRFVSYAIVGGTAAVVNLICFSLLYYRSPIYFGSDATAQSLRYIVVFAIAAEISTLTNFTINDRVTFSKLPGHARSWIVRCLRFHLTTVVGTLLTFVISFTLARLGLAALLAQMTAIGIAFLVNFTLHHVFTYSRLHGHRPLDIDWQGGTLSASNVSNVSTVSNQSEQYTATAAPTSAPAGPPLNFSIIIPAHNEEEALRPTISRLHRRLVDERIPFEILVINDHSTDTTETVLQQLAHEYPGVRYVSNEKPGGFGRAIQTGLEHFAGDAVCIAMADASDDPRDVVTYYRKLQQGYECVFGSRFVSGSKVIDYPRHKLLVNRLANWFINVLFQLHFNDTTNAFKAYRREVIAGVSPILAPHFNITVELPLKAITRGYTYATVPINWYNRATGVSKLKIKEMGSRYLFIVLYIWLEKLLTRGDYRRPQESEADREPARGQVLAQYETMPHKSVPRGAPIDEIDTLKTTAAPPNGSNGSNGGGGAQAAGLPGQWPALQAPPDAGYEAGAAGAAGVALSPASLASAESASRAARIPAWFVWLVSLAIVAIGLAIYARSITILPISDDWVLLDLARRGPYYIFLYAFNYHYNPVVQGVFYVIYLLFGLNPVPYHIVALAFFSVNIVLTLRIGWKLTGSFTVGALAGLLFVLSGRPYEAVIWTVVALYQSLGLIFFLGGLLFYLHAHDQDKGKRWRRWMLVGFCACMVLAVFTYEQEVTLFAVCMLYRLLVLDSQAGWWRASALVSGQVWRARARVWVGEFWFPVVFFAGYLVFKVWLGRQIGVPQAPGLQTGWRSQLVTITIGLYQAFTPGAATGRPLAIEYQVLGGLQAGQPLLRMLVSLAIVYLPLVGVIVFARPLYRWLALWAVLVVASTILGIGYLASRYELLFIVPAVILWAGFLVWLAKKLYALIFFLLEHIAMVERRGRIRTQRLVWALVWLPLLVAVAIYGVYGVHYMSVEIASWQEASDIQGAALQRISALADEHPQARALYLVNLPDGLPNPADRYVRGAWIFLDGSALMTELTLPGRFETVQYVRTPDFNSHQTRILTDRSQVDAYSQDPANLVVCYNAPTRQIEPWGPLCT